MLVVNRGYPHDSQAPSLPIQATKPGFVGDHVRIGASGEVWIIDTIRTWAVATQSQRPGDVFESVALFGGIEAQPQPANQPPQPDCDCHNLMAIKTGILQPGSDRSAAGDVFISSATPGVWQVDFRNIHWSVPGGVDLQFGVMGKSRQPKSNWVDEAIATDDTHSLKFFDQKGKLEGPYEIEDKHVGLGVQVWAHKSAHISIRSASATIEVALTNEGGFDSAKSDPASLRFGPRSAVPIGTRIETIDGRGVLVARFRRTEAGIPSGVASVCLTGRQQDGVPFEGCDLVTSR